MLQSAEGCLRFCGVPVQGERESREENEIQLRREGGTIVYLPGQKSTTWLDM